MTTLKATWLSHTLQFGFAARTSRGQLNAHTIYLIYVYHAHNPNVFGVGECAPLAGLSPEFDSNIPQLLQAYCDKVSSLALTDIDQASIRFAFETALLDLEQGGIRKLFETPFYTGSMAIPTNGLVWIDAPQAMLSQALDKLKAGFDTIKIKIGKRFFEDELPILHTLRNTFGSDIQIRVDANGAFEYEEALRMLEALHTLQVHSIEQPIKAGYWKEMAMLCDNSPIPIGLDEELIGIRTRTQKEQLLKSIQPQYLILKPTLLGGLAQTMEWIELCSTHSIGWWITSALESNVGLNSIAQLCSCYPSDFAQGLGTGMLYTNNFKSPLELVRNKLIYQPHESWELPFPKELM